MVIIAYYALNTYTQWCLVLLLLLLLLVALL